MSPSPASQSLRRFAIKHNLPLWRAQGCYHLLVEPSVTVHESDPIRMLAICQLLTNPIFREFFILKPLESKPNTITLERIA